MTYLPHWPRRGGCCGRGAGCSCSNIGYDPDTFSAGLIEFVTAFVSRRTDIAAGDITAWASDLTGLGPAYFFSLNRYLFLAVRN
jgi:hypothetical protein